MHPQRTAFAIARGEEAEALVPAPEIVALRQATPCQAPEDHRHQQIHHQRIDAALEALPESQRHDTSIAATGSVGSAITRHVAPPAKMQRLNTRYGPPPTLTSHPPGPA